MEERLNTYEDCIKILNTLSTSLEKSLYKNQLNLMEGFLNRVELPLKKLDELSVIHIAGTKGKGSTCAFTERILREHKFKTGFSSGPPLIEVRERFRIDGVPISREEFIRYFKQIYVKLKATSRNQSEPDMPNYRCFIFILAFVIFIDKKVDVAVIEVGIGGKYDGSNILRKVPVVGITSLEIDHENILGSTIEKIAEHKAGIIKNNCEVFTVIQPDDAMKVLKKQCSIKKCKLKIANNLEYNVNFGNAGATWKLNASLAVELSKAWIQYHNSRAPLNGKKEIEWNNDATKRALENVYWPGRFDRRKIGNLNFYLDGAHTKRSITIALEWFVSHTQQSQNRKVLIFNITRDRKADDLLEPFVDCDFDLVAFVSHIPRYPLNPDIIFYETPEQLLLKSKEIQNCWIKKLTERKRSINCAVFNTIEEAIESLRKRKKQYDVLVTGSVRLVGGVFSIIQPNLNHL